MNSDVPHPITHTRSPVAGSESSVASAAAWAQTSGWLASSSSIRLRIGGLLSVIRAIASVDLREFARTAYVCTLAAHDEGRLHRGRQRDLHARAALRSVRLRGP